MIETLSRVLSQGRNYELLTLVKDKPLEERVQLLASVFSEATKHFDDDRAVDLIPLILRAIDDVRLNTPPIDEEGAALQLCGGKTWQEEQVRRDYTLDRYVKQFRDLWCTQLPCNPDTAQYNLESKEGRRKLTFVKTRKVLIRGFLDAWAVTDSDDRARVYWNSLFSLSFGRDYFEHDDLLVDALRDTTDKNVSISPLDQAINCLSEEHALRAFPLLRKKEEGRDKVLRVLLTARARNVKLDRARQEILVLSSVHGASAPAYAALLDEAKKIAAQDVAGQELLRLVTGRTPGLEYSRDDQIVGGVISLEFPDRLTIVIKILWDANNWSNRCNRQPEDKVLHHWMEMGLDRAIIWRKGYNADHSPSMKVIVRLFTCEKVYGDKPREEKPFREEVAK